MTNITISFQPLHKALASLQRALQQIHNEYTRDAVIQRFEYTYELTWKTLKRYLKLAYEVDETLPIKQSYREAARVGLITNLTTWFGYHDARNLTSHTYNEDTAEEAYATAKEFATDAAKLLEKLEQHTKHILITDHFAQIEENELEG